MGGQGEPGLLAIFADQEPRGFAAEGGASLAHKKGVRLGLHFGPVGQPRLDSPQLIRPQRLGGGQALFQAGDVQDAAFGVHLRQNQSARLGDAQTVAEHEEQKASVAGFVSCAFGGRQQPFDLV